MLPTAMRKKPLVAFDGLERAAALDLRAKLLGRLQLAAVGGDEDNEHAFADEVIAK